MTPLELARQRIADGYHMASMPDAAIEDAIALLAEVDRLRDSPNWTQDNDLPEPQSGFWLVTVEQKIGRRPEVPGVHVRTFYLARLFAPAMGRAWVEDDKYQSQPGTAGKILSWCLVPWWADA